MKIALAAVQVADGNLAFNIQQMRHYMLEAKRQGVDLVCFGESCLQGFNALCWDYEKDKDMAVSVDSAVFSHICGLSADIGIDVLFGYIERAEDVLYSSCALIMEGILYHNYRRISRGWKEYRKTDDHYREGTAPAVFEYRGRKCAIGLCGDLWDYPERFSLGQEILFWPVYVSWTEDEWYHGGREEYAFQANLCCANTLYINSICEADAFGGALWFSGGNVKAELPVGREGLLLLEL